MRGERFGQIDRLGSLFGLMSRVAAADSEAEALVVVVDRGSVVAGASAAVVGWVEGDLVRVVAERGYPAGYLDSWRTFPLEPGRPMSDVVASGRAVFCGSREERDRRWPLFQGTGRWAARRSSSCRSSGAAASSAR